MLDKLQYKLCRDGAFDPEISEDGRILLRVPCNSNYSLNGADIRPHQIPLGIKFFLPQDYRIRIYSIRILENLNVISLNDGYPFGSGEEFNLILCNFGLQTLILSENSVIAEAFLEYNYSVSALEKIEDK